MHPRSINQDSYLKSSVHQIAKLHFGIICTCGQKSLVDISQTCSLCSPPNGPVLGPENKSNDVKSQNYHMIDQILQDDNYPMTSNIQILTGCDFKAFPIIIGRFELFSMKSGVNTFLNTNGLKMVSSSIFIIQLARLQYLLLHSIIAPTLNSK